MLSLIKDYVSRALRTGLPKASKAMPPVLPSSPESLPGGFSPHHARPAVIHRQPAATPGLHHQRLPPASTAPVPRYPCHGSAFSGRPIPGRHTPCGRCFTFVQHDRNTRSPLLSEEAERSRSRAPPASSAGRKTKGSPKASKRTSLSERSEFLFFSPAGRLSSW